MVTKKKKNESNNIEIEIFKFYKDTIEIFLFLNLSQIW